MCPMRALSKDLCSRGLYTRCRLTDIFLLLEFLDVQIKQLSPSPSQSPYLAAAFFSLPINRQSLYHTSTPDDDPVVCVQMDVDIGLDVITCTFEQVMVSCSMIDVESLVSFSEACSWDYLAFFFGTGTVKMVVIFDGCLLKRCARPSYLKVSRSATSTSSTTDHHSLDMV